MTAKSVLVATIGLVMTTPKRIMLTSRKVRAIPGAKIPARTKYSRPCVVIRSRGYRINVITQRNVVLTSKYRIVLDCALLFCNPLLVGIVEKPLRKAVIRAKISAYTSPSSTHCR